MSEYLKLDNQLCFPLYALSRQVTNMYRPMLDELGLTYPQYLVMMVLLGERLWLDSGTLTPLLKRMESNKLIKRERSTEDERLVNITITEQGLALKKQAEKIPNLIKCKINLEDEEIIALRNQLKKILLSTDENN